MAQLSTPKRWGHLLGIVTALANVAGVALPTGSDDSDGPPLGVLVVGAAIGLVAIGLLAWSWAQDRKGPRRAAAIILVLAAVTALPAFVGDISAGVRAAAAVGVLLTLVSVVLLFYPDRRAAVGSVS